MKENQHIIFYLFWKQFVIEIINIKDKIQFISFKKYYRKKENLYLCYFKIFEFWIY